MTTPQNEPRQFAPMSCYGKPEGLELATPCRTCLRLTVPGPRRIVHMLAPRQFVGGVCPMRLQK